MCESVDLTWTIPSEDMLLTYDSGLSTVDRIIPLTPVYGNEGSTK